MFVTLRHVLPFTPYPYRGEKVACDLCGGTDVEVICEHDRRLKPLRTVACIGCGLMRTDPMPTIDEIARYYGGTYRRDYQLTRTPSRRHLHRTWREATKRLELLRPALRPGARVLDFGSGAGVFLGAAAANGCAVQGIEPGHDFARYAVEIFGVDVISGLWEHIDRPLGPFDVITSVEVLEHLRRPVGALRWLRSLLAEDGIIYVTVPNMVPNNLEPFRRFHFAHLHNFTPSTLLWAGMVAGLEPDPRFPQEQTQMVFRKAAAALDPAAIRKNHGAGLSAQYPKASIIRYLFSPAYFAGRIRQLFKTLRDTVAPSA